MFMRNRAGSALICFLAFAQARAYADGPAPGAVTAETVRLPSGPSSVRGLADNASVSAFTGQVRYSVPISLPVAPGGVQPSLSLGYDGGLGNGELGVGWSLALPTIRRSLRLGVPAYDATDELELVGLAGGQLVAIPGGYRVEGRGNAIRGVASDGGFILTDADGTAYTLGTTAAARTSSALGDAVWHLEQIRTASGVTIDYLYSQDQGEVYLDAIEWGPGPAGARLYRAELVYELRPDAVVSWRTGGRIATAKRMQKIRVIANGGVQRTVTVTYDNTFALSRISGVRVTGIGDVDALPPLAFTYAAATAGVTTPVAGVDGWALDHQGTSLFDVDQDGAMDLLRLTTSGHSFRRNIGGGFGPVQAMPGAPAATLDKVRLLDLTGDSIAEMVWQQGSQWMVYSFTPGSAPVWTSVGALSGAANLALGTAGIADLDGDYRMDTLHVSGSTLRVRMGGATGLGAPLVRPAVDVTRPFVQPGAAATRLADINGDGLADVVHLATAQMYLYLGRGDGTFEKLADIAYPWAGTVTPAQIHLADLDRDGLLDVAAVRAGDVTWHRGLVGGAFSTTGTSVSRPPGTDATVVVTAADANGNGSTDLVWSSPAGMWIVDLAGPTTAGMLIAIDNGLGQRQTFIYEASTQLAFSASPAWTSTAPVSIPVATRSGLELASGEPRRSNRLDVRDIIYDRDERRFVGFLEATVTRPDPADGVPVAQLVRQVQRFAPGLGMDRAIRGQVVRDQIVSGTGTVLRETVSDVAAVAVAGLPDEARLRVAITRSTEVRFFEGQPVPLVTRQELEYDPEGRAIVERELGRVDQIGDESITRRRYTEGVSTNGVRDEICEERLLVPDASAPEGERLVEHVQTRFGSATAIAPLCDASVGWVRTKQKWLASESRWVEIEAASYNADGDAIAKTTGGVTHELEYDAKGHPNAEIVRPSPTRTLRWEMTWDPIAEVVLEIRDASGASSTLGYDGLGRLRSIAHSGALPHVHYRYTHSGPRPFTETFAYDGPAGSVPALPATWTPASKWRHTVAVSNSAGESVFAAIQLAGTRWLVTDRRVRDALGRETAMAEPYAFTGTLAELVASELPAATPRRTVTYDALDRAIQQTLPTGEQVTHTYRAYELVDSASGLASVTSTIDGHGRIVRTQRTVNGVVESADAIYDTAGRITKMRFAGAAASVEHQYAYDSLGRLVSATDPDIGPRSFTYDDAGRILTQTNGAGQAIAYTYDGAGRLATATAGTEVVTYHYDDALDPTGFAYTASRLAWVEEPTGRLEIGYDRDGHEIRRKRLVDGRSAEHRISLTASGKVSQLDDGEGFTLGLTYDAAGRLTAIGDLWQADTLDVAGRVTKEHFGNGVVQTWTRDSMGRATRSKILAPSGSLYYDVKATYHATGAIATLTDLDGTGLDHSAAYAFDGAGRLTTARVGSAGPNAYQFAYAYDGLQNMVRREARGPTSLGIVTGIYKHGEPTATGIPRGPRQLTSVMPDVTAGSPPAATPTTLDYDAAGRVIRSGALGLSYDAWDRLVRVTGLPGGEVAHRYGHDGLRVRTIAPNGTGTTWFSQDVSQTDDGVRRIDIRDGTRLLARITRTPSTPLASSEPAALSFSLGSILATTCLALVMLLAIAWRARRRVRWVLAFSAVVAVHFSCSTTTSALQQSAFTTTDTVYYHAATSAGPSLMTRADGTIFDERRYEPFGATIDSYRMLESGGIVIGPVDLQRDPHDSLNHERDPATGWSYQGARWLAPELAVWASPDPPVKGPDEALMSAPWAAHPYQFVQQNPIAFWDPDGGQPAPRGGDGGGNPYMPSSVAGVQRTFERHSSVSGVVNATFDAQLGDVDTTAAAATGLAIGKELGWIAVESIPYAGPGVMIARGKVISGLFFLGLDLVTGGGSSLARGGVNVSRTVHALHATENVVTTTHALAHVGRVTETAVKTESALVKAATVATRGGSAGVQNMAKAKTLMRPPWAKRSGIYWFRGKSGCPYIGQSCDIARRLGEHGRSGKLPAGSIVSFKDICCDKLAREIAEHLKIKAVGGARAIETRAVENRVYPIGKAREHLLP